jgi:hypothetical protein
MSYEIEYEGREENYSIPLHRAALRDSRLSWGARGLFAFMWDLPRGWILRSSHLAKMAPGGRDALRARLSELREVGALRIEKIQDEEGKLKGSRWVIVTPARWAVESPLSPSDPLSPKGSTESRETRLSDFPTLGKPAYKVYQGFKGIQKGSSSKQEDVDNSSCSQRRKQLKISEEGVCVWNRQDEETAAALKGMYGIDLVKKAVLGCVEMGIEPLPSNVQKVLLQFS